MRTTISIDDALLEQLKRQAADRGTTVSRIIEDSVRLAARLAREPEADTELELVTFGRGGRFTRLNVDKTPALLELDDVDRFGSGEG